MNKYEEKIMEGIKSGIEIYRQLKEKLYENVAWRKTVDNSTPVKTKSNFFL